MPDLLSDADTFAPGETVNVYQGRDESLSPFTTAVAASDGSVAVIGLPPWKPYTLKGVTTGIRRRMFAEDKIDAGASVAGFAEVPFGQAGSKSPISVVANRAYLVLLPRDCLGRVATGVGFNVEAYPAAEEAMDCGYYRQSGGILQKIASSGSLAGRLYNPGATTDEYQYPNRAPQASGPAVRLPADADVYVAFAVGAVSATPTSISGSDQGMSVYGPSGNSDMALGLVKALYKDAAFPLPATITDPAGIKIAPNLVAQFQHRIVGLGDSIMRGDPGGALLSSRMSFPTKLNSRLGPHAWILNAGIGGEKTDDMLARIQVVKDQYPSEVIIMAGINDFNAGRDDTTTIAGLLALYQAVESVGARVIALTILPFGSSGFWTSTKETYRVNVNNWIKNTSGRRYVDLDQTALADFTFYGPAKPMLRLIYETDPIHPNSAGFDLMADAVFKDPRGYNATITPRQ